MSILCDSQIKLEIEWGNIGIDPYDPNLMQPASIDMRLGNQFRVFPSNIHGEYREIHPKEDIDYTVLIDLTSHGETWIKVEPGQFVLASTLERIRIPNNMVARIEGKSSLGRLGLAIHATAGFIDPGFEGWITLELSNLNSLPIRLYPGMKIAQMSFMYTYGITENPYGSANTGSKYQNQEGPTPSRYYENINDRR